LFSLLDALGSTLSSETVRGFWAKFGKTGQESLTMDEVVICLEEQLLKKDEDKRRLAQNEIESGMMTPKIIDGKINGFPAPGNGLEYLGIELSQIGESQEGEEELLELDNRKDEDMSKNMKPITGGAKVVNALNGDVLQAPEDNHLRGPRRADSSSNSSLSSMTDLIGSSISKTIPPTPLMFENSDINLEENFERLVNIKICPLCQKNVANADAELDVITHMAVCASQDWKMVDKIMVGNFVTASQAHRKFFTKLISKVSAGTYRLGAVSFFCLFSKGIP
jgi:phosphatidylserine decarboxylase